jgi:hypothetical protein
MWPSIQILLKSEWILKQIRNGTVIITTDLIFYFDLLWSTLFHFFCYFDTNYLIKHRDLQKNFIFHQINYCLISFVYLTLHDRESRKIEECLKRHYKLSFAAQNLDFVFAKILFRIYVLPKYKKKKCFPSSHTSCCRL